MRVLIQILGSGVFLNFGLMAFNLLPVAPLDGSNILQLFIPPRWEDQYARIMQRGPVILLFLILLGAFTSVSPLSVWVFGIMDFVLQMLGKIASLFL